MISIGYPDLVVESVTSGNDRAGESVDSDAIDGARERSMSGRGIGAETKESVLDRVESGTRMVDVDAVSGALSQAQGVLSMIQVAGLDRDGFSVEHDDVMNAIWAVERLVNCAAAALLSPPPT